MDTSQYTIQLTNRWTQEQLNTASSTGPITPLRSYEGNWTAVVRGCIPVHLEVCQNLGCILPEQDLTEQDIRFFVDFFAQSIRDMGFTPAVANRIQYRVWIAFPTAANRTCPAGWVADTTVPPTATPAGTDIQGSYTFFRRDLQFDDSWNIRQPDPPAVGATFQFNSAPHQQQQFTFRAESQPAPPTSQPSFGSFPSATLPQAKPLQQPAQTPGFTFQPGTRAESKTPEKQGFSGFPSLSQPQGFSFQTKQTGFGGGFPSSFSGSNVFNKKGYWTK